MLGKLRSLQRSNGRATPSWHCQLQCTWTHHKIISSKLLLLFIRALFLRILRLVAVIFVIFFLSLFLLPPFRYLYFLQRGVRVNTELFGHESVNAVHQSRRVGDLITRFNQRCLEENLSSVQCCFVLFVRLHLTEKIDDYRMVRIDFQSLSAPC